MIKSINSTGQHITVQGGSLSLPYLNTSTLSVGQLRFNPSTQNIEVYDGYSWYNMQSNVEIDLNSHTKEIIAWAEKKMLQENTRQLLAKENPTLADLLQQAQDLEQQISMIESLLKIS